MRQPMRVLMALIPFAAGCGGNAAVGDLPVQPDPAPPASVKPMPASPHAVAWPMFRGNALQDGVSPTELPDRLEQLWTFTTNEAIEGAPAIVDGVVYAGSMDEHLYALRLSNGQLLWKQKIGPVKASPAVRDGAIYVGNADGRFYCLSAATGETRWTFTTDGETEITAGANFADDTVLFGCHDSTLYCLACQDGQLRWRFKTEGPVNGSPAVVPPLTFVAGCDSNLHVLDVRKGREVAVIDMGGQCGASAAVRDGLVYVGTMTNQVLAIDPQTKTVVWRYEAARRRQPFYSSAAVTDSLVIVGGRDKRVVALDRAKGHEVWSYLTGNRVDSSPVVAAGRVIVGSLDKYLYVLDLAQGSEKQKIRLDGPIPGSPAVAADRVVIGTETGRLYCFGEAARSAPLSAAEIPR